MKIENRLVECDMLNFQEELDLSPHSCLYDILVKEDHLLRKLNNLVDFSFIITLAAKMRVVFIGRKLMIA